MNGTRAPAARRDAVRNYHRILAAAREVLDESGADACMEEIAARAGVGVGMVNPGITVGDVMALIWAMRGLVQAAGERPLSPPASWRS